jgi:hypothetical protein
MPYYDAGLYLIPNASTVTNPNQLVLIKNDPNYNEAWPRAVVPYAAVHGVAEPVALPWLPNDGSLRPELPAGTPYGLVGTSSVYKRESFPGFVPPWSDTFDGLDAFNTAENGQSSNWERQGADAGKYANSDIRAIRIVGMEPNTHRSYGPNGGPSGGSRFYSHAGEKLRILGEIPLRKFAAGGAPILDPEGNPDTSFLVWATFSTMPLRSSVWKVNGESADGARAARRAAHPVAAPRRRPRRRRHGARCRLHPPVPRQPAIARHRATHRLRRHRQR